jgi:hypothetical protein
MNKTLKEVLMSRDNMTEEEADEAIKDARDQILNEGTDPEEVLMNEFGLEPDYTEDLLF